MRQGADKADIRASFSNTDNVSGWLEQHDYPSEDDVCILRRVITQEGRSRGYINGRPASATELKALANQLMDIHGQHAHQSLLQKDAPRQLLDNYAKLTPLAQKTKSAYLGWQRADKKRQTEPEQQFRGRSPAPTSKLPGQ